MDMRDLIELIEAALPQPQKWWINAVTGEVIDVSADHFDVFDAKRFGVSDEEIQDIKSKWTNEADGAKARFAEEMIFWSIAHAAMLKGWVRAGSFGADGLDHAYIYAARLRDAQKALKWMMQQGHFCEKVGIEILNPDEPTLGDGEFIEIEDARELKRFLAQR